MIVRFSRRAASDLTEVSTYLRSHNRVAAARVRAAILDSIELLNRFPNAGRRQDFEDVRKLVVPRYPYLIYYTVDQTSEQILIVTIQHSARQREYSDL